ncbi:MAG: DUF1206 domain-containing protein [Nocardia sp.]|nr:DUF1206 domain-containing protein [Nocardia sp.]
MIEVSTSGPKSAVNRVTRSRVFERFARAGFVMAGVVHLLIGYLAVRIAFGGSGSTDQSGAMAELATKPGGVPALVFAVAAFVFMALWRLTEAALGSRDGGDEDRSSDLFHRGKALAVALVYFGYALTAFSFVRGSGKSSGGQNAGLSARLMESTGGKVALVVAGLVIIAVGGYHIYKGATRKFLEKLHTHNGLVRKLGTVGYLSKGSAIAGVGVLVIVAVNQSDPGKASGLDAALKTLGGQPFGPVLLVAAGLGIAAYGLYDLACARYAKM